MEANPIDEPKIVKNRYRKYYDAHKEEMNERRLFCYYTKKFGKELVDDMKKQYGPNAISCLRTYSRNMTKIPKLQILKQKIDNQLNLLINV